MIVLMPSKPRDAKKVVMKTLVRKVVFCSWLIVPAGVKSIPVTFLDISIEKNIEDYNCLINLTVKELLLHMCQMSSTPIYTGDVSRTNSTAQLPPGLVLQIPPI